MIFILKKGYEKRIFIYNLTAFIFTISNHKVTFATHWVNQYPVGPSLTLLT